MAKIQKYFKIVQPKGPNSDVYDSQDLSGSFGGLYGNYSNFFRITQGSAQRIQRYHEYDIMDTDTDVARALDIIAEEMTGNVTKGEQPLDFVITTGIEKEIPSSTMVTIRAALKTWCEIQDFSSRIFFIARNMIKHGDAFFYRPKKAKEKMVFIQPRSVISAVSSTKDITDVVGWHIKSDTKKVDKNQFQGNLSFVGSTDTEAQSVDFFKKEEIVRFSILNEMSKDAPFGQSILNDVYRTFKHKELLEDSFVIFRIQRAPEKRVYNIELGGMPADRASVILENIKSEIKQKKIPTAFGGSDSNSVSSTYNPQSMSEDFFFAQRNGQSSSVNVLGGTNSLDELADLNYFFKKIWRGLRIPESYISNSVEGGQTFNDGRVGIAYMQEIKFTIMVQRLQAYMERSFDKEFKNFLQALNINIDPTIFRVTLPEPTQFAKSRQQQMNGELLGNYNSADGMESLSKRFALKKFLQLTDEEIELNERMRREELGLDPDGGKKDLPKLYAPDQAEAGGFEGGLGGMGGGPGDMGEGGGLEGEEGEEGEDDVDLGLDDDEDATPTGDEDTPEPPETQQ